MNFNKINMEAKEYFDRYTKKYGYINMESNFCVMYIWQEMMNIQYAMMDDVLLVCTRSLEHRCFFVEPKHYNRDEDIMPVFNYVKKQPNNCTGEFLMKGITDDYTRKLIRGGFMGEIYEDINNYEYVYLQENLANLTGKKYTQKRNHINRLLNEHTYEYLPYEDNMRDDVFALFDAWGEKSDSPKDVRYERRAIERALNEREQLNVDGGVILLDGKLSAFCLGTPGDDDMYCVLFEKADDVNGLYQLINREFAKSLHNYTYINRQEDMGIEGLRRAKRSYNPVKFVEKKYILTY